MCSGVGKTTCRWLTLVVISIAMCSGFVREDTVSVPAVAAYRAGENNGCTAVRLAYGGKGFRYEDVPLSMITGQCTASVCRMGSGHSALDVPLMTTPLGFLHFLRVQVDYNGSRVGR